MKNLNKEFSEWIEAQIKLNNLYISKVNSRFGTKGSLTGKWKEKYNSKVRHQKKSKNKFLLTFQEYLYKAYEAGLTCPSKVSTKGNSKENYNLSRYQDQGNYTVDNCRFISQYLNIKERDLYKKNNLFHLNKNKNPWNNNNTNLESRKVWVNSHEIYSWWIDNNKSLGYTYLQKHLNNKSKSCRTILSKFKQGWVPLEDKDWVSWRENVENTMYS